MMAKDFSYVQHLQLLRRFAQILSKNLLSQTKLRSYLKNSCIPFIVQKIGLDMGQHRGRGVVFRAMYLPLKQISRYTFKVLKGAQPQHEDMLTLCCSWSFLYFSETLSLQ